MLAIMAIRVGTLLCPIDAQFRPPVTAKITMRAHT
jgi:hypothetical protein